MERDAARLCQTGTGRIERPQGGNGVHHQRCFAERFGALPRKTAR
jgi:hypothetical protein